MAPVAPAVPKKPSATKAEAKDPEKQKAKAASRRQTNGGGTADGEEPAPKRKAPAKKKDNAAPAEAAPAEAAPAEAATADGPAPASAKEAAQKNEG